MDTTLMGLAVFGANRLQHRSFSPLSAARALLGLPFGPAGGIAAAPTSAAAASFLGLDGPLLGGHRIVIHDLAYEDPHLDANDAVGRLRDPIAEIDVGAQGMQRHAALPVPLDAGNFRAAQPTRAIDADAEGAQTQGGLHSALHGATEGDPTLELLGNGLGHEGGVDLRLSHLDDVEMHLRRGQLCQLAAQLLDIGALFADQHARPRRVHRHPAFLVRALDHHAGDAGLAPLLQDMVANMHILVQQFAVLAAAGEPATVPGAIDADPQTDRINLVTHLFGLLRRGLLRLLLHDDRELGKRLLDGAHAAAATGMKAPNHQILADVGLANDEIVDIEPVIVLGVRHRRHHTLAHVLGDALAREFQVRERGLDLLAANQ